MRVLTLWWIAMFCVLFAVGMLAFGRALDYQQNQQSSYCGSGGALAGSTLCK